MKHGVDRVDGDNEPSAKPDCGNLAATDEFVSETARDAQELARLLDRDRQRLVSLPSTAAGDARGSRYVACLAPSKLAVHVGSRVRKQMQPRVRSVHGSDRAATARTRRNA